MTYIIKAITKPELVQIMLEWAKKLDWKYSENDVDAYFEINGKNIYSLNLYNASANQYELIGCISISKYNFIASIGLFIIKEEHRGKNHGQQLLDYALKELSGSILISLNAVPKAVAYYSRNGFFHTGTVNSHFSLKSENIKGKLSKEFSSNLTISDLSLIEDIIKYDSELFHNNSERKKFINLWLTRPDAIIVTYSCGYKIEGYGVLTVCSHTSTTKSYRISPMVADTIDVAAGLFYKLFSYIETSNFNVIELNALSNINSCLIDLLKSLGFNKIEDGDTELMVTEKNYISRNNTNASLFKVIAMSPLEFPHEVLQISTKSLTL